MNTQSTDQISLTLNGSRPRDEAATGRGELVEPRSIDYIPWKERHGKVWHQGPFWFTSNFVLLTLGGRFHGPFGRTRTRLERPCHPARRRDRHLLHGLSRQSGTHGSESRR